MLQLVKASLSFLTTVEKTKLFSLIFLRALLSLLDLAGILAIGFLVTSTAVALTAGAQAPGSLNFAGLEIPTVNSTTLPLVSAAVLALFLVKAFLSIILTKKAAFFVARIEARASKKIAEISFGGDLGDARKRSREEMMFAIQAGSPAAFNVLLNSINTFITETTLFIVVLVGFFFVDALATLAAVVYFGLVVGIMQFFVGSLMSRAGEVNAQQSVRASTAISDLVAVFRELLVLGNRDKYINDIYEAKLASAESSATQYYLGGMPRYIIEAALLVGIALFVLSQALSGDIVRSAGTIGIFLSGGFRLTAALLPLQNSLLTIKSIIPSAKTAHDILALGVDTSHHSHLDKTTVPLESKIQAQEPIGVEFKNVSFSYPNSRDIAVKNLNFIFQPGSQVALMGPSGAGKSTIADLICRVIKPTKGEINLVGFETNQSIQKTLGGVSYVPQKPGLVSGTIADNVALGVESDEINRGRVFESLELSHLGTLIEQLPEGIDTPLGKLQDGLSGGQIQRLGLARALYSKPGLLVMDEATSALDAESEFEIQKALADMRGTVTVVLIAHRLNTIQHADMVLLVEDGEVTDSGSFKELQTRNQQVDRLVNLMKIDPNN
jgi:ABC-type multidrug transport system fused ATPase/permease subunit